MCNFSFIAVCARFIMRSLKFPPLPNMNKNITSGYSGVKLLRETYTLESSRDPCRSRRPVRYSWRVNTPFTRDIIRGRLHIRAHWSRSCRVRRFYADVYHFTSPPSASSSSISHPLELPFSPYDDTLHVLGQGDRRANSLSRKTGSPYVRAGSA